MTLHAPCWSHCTPHAGAINQAYCDRQQVWGGPAPEPCWSDCHIAPEPCLSECDIAPPWPTGKHLSTHFVQFSHQEEPRIFPGFNMDHAALVAAAERKALPFPHSGACLPLCPILGHWVQSTHWAKG